MERSVLWLSKMMGYFRVDNFYSALIANAKDLFSLFNRLIIGIYLISFVEVITRFSIKLFNIIVFYTIKNVNIEMIEISRYIEVFYNCL